MAVLNDNRSNVQNLPVWKKNATAEERLCEFAQVARRHPEAFSRMILVYVEDLPSGRTITRTLCDEKTTTFEALGILQTATDELLGR